MSAELTGGIPENCEWKDLVKGSKDQGDEPSDWKKDVFSKCYQSMETQLRAKTDEEKKEALQKALQDKYSGTSVATGSIGAGAGGLACGLGLFPCLVKLVSKFR